MPDNKNTLLDNSNDLFFEDVEGEQAKQLVLEESQAAGLVGAIQKRFEDAETARLPHEGRWLTGYRNFRGLYDKNLKYL